ncbi:hypothetical protein LN650_07540 [Klebsiella pneumoniae subsp. pneumoniae]|nr:hypothetical protein [Klebsiella pneumoniae subsp. pneumoniae]
MSDLGQQGLFDITRLLLQQPDLAALSETLPRLVQQSALADEAAIILWNAGNHRAARYACDEAGHPVSYEDETVPGPRSGASLTLPAGCPALRS